MKIRFFCVLITFFLILSEFSGLTSYATDSVPTSLATSESAPTSTTPDSIPPSTEVTTSIPASSESSSSEDSSTPATPSSLTTLFNESVSDNFSISSSNDTVIPLNITSQGDVNITINYPELSTDYICKVYTDDSYISMIYSCLLSSSTNSYHLTITAGGPETLYLYFTPNKKTTQEIIYPFNITAKLSFSPTKSTTSSKKIKNKVWTKKKMATSKTKHYYKLVLTKNQYFHINSNNSNINLQILDKSKKKALSSTVTLKSSNNYHSSFALGKGTYYILVTANRPVSYQLYVRMNTVKKQYGDTLKSSPRITFGKQYLGMIKANTPIEQGQYYRFKLTSSQKIQIAFYVENSSDSFQLQIYDGNKEPLPTNNYKMTNAGLLYINSRAPMPADVYYLKITKTKQRCSGCYSLIVRKQF